MSRTGVDGPRRLKRRAFLAGAGTLLVLVGALLIYSLTRSDVPDDVGAAPDPHYSITIVEPDDKGIDWPAWVSSAGTVVTPVIVAFLTYRLGRRAERRDAARRAAGNEPAPPPGPANLPSE